MKKQNTIKPFLILIGIGLMSVACGSNEGEKSPDLQEKEIASNSQSTVQVIRKSDLELRTVKNETVTTYLPITGRVIPKNTTQLVAEVQGRILPGTKPFKAGTSFYKGQTILRIDGREFALNLESQKNAFLNILTGMMPDLKADYPDNYQNWLKYGSNYESGGALPVLPQTTSDSEKYFVTSRQVYNTYYSIKAQEERLNKFILSAPYSGSLSVALVDNGGLVSPGQPLGTFISNQSYEIESAVSLKLASTLKVGQKIAFTSRELNKTFTATIARVNDIVDPSTQNIPVFLSVKDKVLRSGMYLEGRVSSETYENAISIPIAILERDNTVHILEDGVIKKQEVAIMSTGTDTVTVRGLADNSQLILTTFENPISGLKLTE